MRRGKEYWISLITVALNYAGKREMLFMHEKNTVGSMDQRGLAFVVSLCYKTCTRGRIGVSCQELSVGSHLVLVTTRKKKKICVQW